MSKPPPARYRTTNWFSYNAALRRRGSMLIWVDQEMAWLAPPEGRPGRPSVFSDAATWPVFAPPLTGGMAQTAHRGLDRVAARFTMTMAACNLARLPKLLAT